jgi:hypothetical protein
MEMVKHSGAIDQDSVTATAIDRFSHDRAAWHSRDKNTSQYDINDWRCCQDVARVARVFTPAICFSVGSAGNRQNLSEQGGKL